MVENKKYCGKQRRKMRYIGALEEALDAARKRR